MKANYPLRFMIHQSFKIPPSLFRTIKKFQNHQNTFEATPITVLHGLSFQIIQNMLRSRRTYKLYTLLSGHLTSTKKRT